MNRQLTFDGVVERAVASRSDPSVRAGVGGVVTGVGTGLAGLLVARLLEGYPTLLGTLVGGVFPLVLAIVGAVGGVLLFSSDLDATQSGHVGFWWLIGTLVAGTAGFALVVFEASNGVDLSDPAVVVAGNAATGGLGGLVVGWFDARRLAIAAERERERQQLADEREKLVLINRIVRHDIGNDLQVVAGMADVLERHVEPEGAEVIDRLQRTTEDALDLTERVRAFVSTLDDEADDLRPIAVRRIVRTQVDNLRERHPEVTITVTDPVPDVAVQADELLSTVLHNLLSNAVTHNDSPDPHVIVDVETEPETVRIRVADDGPGIPPSSRETMFDRGELGPESDGTGIGLYIVATLVEHYDGSIRIEDRQSGQGVAFVVELPRVQSDE